MSDVKEQPTVSPVIPIGTSTVLTEIFNGFHQPSRPFPVERFGVGICPFYFTSAVLNYVIFTSAVSNEPACSVFQ
jgi:hypothetical protein